MSLIGLRDVSVSFGGPSLLDHVDFQIHHGERVCLLGRNGAGKSTLLRILHGAMEPDDGLVTRRPGLRIGLLPQEVPRELHGSTAEIVASGLTGADGAARSDRGGCGRPRRGQLHALSHEVV